MARIGAALAAAIRSNQPPYMHVRYIRLLRFSFLILIACSATLEPRSIPLHTIGAVMGASGRTNISRGWRALP